MKRIRLKPPDSYTKSESSYVRIKKTHGNRIQVAKLSVLNR